MKLNYFLKSFALIALMALAVNVNAKEITVANNATDTELAAALEQAETDDVILIGGWVTINNTVTIEKNVTIKLAPSAQMGGFDGQGMVGLFIIKPEPIDGKKLVFEGLDFTGGYRDDGSGSPSDETSGGAAIINAGVTEFNSCFIYENIAGRGGAFFIVNDGTTVTFRNCEATNNIAQGLSGEESRAGYMFVDGETHTTHEYCKISGNQSIGGRGGALCLFGKGTHRFYYTAITDNRGGNWSDDETPVQLDKDGNPVMGDNGPYEGGVAFINGTPAITFESCGIVANMSWSHGGIIRGLGSANVTFINSTLAKNQTLSNRAPLWIGGNSTYTFVNSLVVENIGSNSGNGAGFDYDGANVHLNVYNSVFTNNYTKSGEGAVDIRNASNYATQLVVKNSIIGLIQGNSTGVVAQDNPNIPTKSIINMYKVADEPAQLAYADMENSGVDFGQGLRYSKLGMPYYLLKPGSTVTTLGDPALLGEYDINTDLFERERTIAADNSITAAPTLVATGDDYDDNTVDISNPQISAVKESIRIIGASNGILGVDFGDLKGIAKGTLVSVTGQEVEQAFNINVVGKGYYNIHVAPGMYVLKVEIGGKTYAQKLVVTK